MGVFTILNSPGYGEKLTKFKQKKLIEAAHAGSLIDDTHFSTTMKKGACAPYSMARLREQLDPEMRMLGVRYFERPEGAKKSINAESIRTAAAHVDQNKKFLRKHRRDGDDAGLILLAHKYGLDVDLGSKIQTSDLFPPLGDFLRSIAAKVSHDQGYLIFYDIGTPWGVPWAIMAAHAVAIFRSGSRLYFFDPNLGEYAVFSPAFFDEYSKLLIVKLKWTPTNLRGWRVIKAPLWRSG